VPGFKQLLCFDSSCYIPRFLMKKITLFFVHVLFFVTLALAFVGGVFAGQGGSTEDELEKALWSSNFARAREILESPGGGRSKRQTLIADQLANAVEGDRLDIVRFFIDEKWIDLKTGPRSLLHTAARNGSHKTLRYLVETEKMDLRDPDEWKMLPLHRATIGGHLKCVKYLARKDPGSQDVIDYRGRTALHYAARHAHGEILKFLAEEARERVGSKDLDGYTPLHLVFYPAFDSYKRFDFRKTDQQNAAEIILGVPSQTFDNGLGSSLIDPKSELFKSLWKHILLDFSKSEKRHLLRTRYPVCHQTLLQDSFDSINVNMIPDLLRIIMTYTHGNAENKKQVAYRRNST
jgi:hypothetical protein